MRYDITIAGVIFAAMWTTSVAAAPGADTAAAYAETMTLKVEGPIDTGMKIDELDTLDREFATGDMDRAREIAKSIINTARTVGAQQKKEAFADDAFDYQKNYLAIAWVGSDVAGKLTVRRLVVPQPLPRPYSQDLPGIGAREKLYELFLTGDPRSTLVTVYRSTPEENPILKEIPEVVSEIIGPLFGVVAGVAGELGPSRAAAKTIARADEIKTARAAVTVRVTASRVMLPYRRATIQTKSVALVPKTRERLKADVDLLAATLRLQDAAGFRCAQDYADQLAALVTSVAESAACVNDEPPGVKCLREFDRSFGEAYKTALSNCGGASNDETRTMKAVDKEFREFVAKGAEQVTTDTTFRNMPLTHLAFAAVTAYAFEGKVDEPRVKLDGDGNIVADPLGRLLTMIAVNWSPRGYDADLLEPSNHERFRLFGGAIITPDFGAGGGGSLLLVRGLAINAGIGVVFSRAVDSAEAIGKPPENAAKPFVVGMTPILFVGASFNRK